MNYFAHARLAATRTRGPVFVLGAMLPDWIRWIGARLDHVGDPLLARGIAFHHRCDAAFHRSPRFAERVAWGVARTLAPRPRLRVEPAHLPALGRWARAEQPEIERQAPSILAETEAGLRESA